MLSFEIIFSNLTFRKRNLNKLVKFGHREIWPLTANFDFIPEWLTEQ